MNRNLVKGVLLTASLGLLCGCIAPRVHSTVPAFAHAVDLSAANTESAFQTVEQKHAEVQAMRLVIHYDKRGFNPADVKDWLAPEDLAARMKLFEALKQYSAELAAVSGTGQVQQMDSSAKDLGASLTKLAGSDVLKNISSGTSMAPNVAATAVDGLGRWLIEKKRNKELPELIRQMQGPIKTISDLLSEDIGNRQAGTSRGSGLRQQLWMEYTELITDQDEFIRQNEGQFSPEQKLAQIQRLPALVREQRQADQMLAQTQLTLQQLVKANDELLKAVTTKRDLRTQIEDLVAEGERIKDFYSSLSANK